MEGNIKDIHVWCNTHHQRPVVPFLDHLDSCQDGLKMTAVINIVQSINCNHHGPGEGGIIMEVDCFTRGTLDKWLQ